MTVVPPRVTRTLLAFNIVDPWIVGYNQPWISQFLYYPSQMVLTKCMLYCCILPALILEFATEPIFIFVVLTYQFSTTIVSGAQYYWVKLCGWFLWKVRRHINLRIEAQRRYLEKMTEEHRYLSTIIGKPHRPSKSLPSLCKESESDTRECTSDSEAVGTGYLNSTSEFPELSRGYSSQKDTCSEEIQAQKRPRAVDFPRFELPLNGLESCDLRD